MPPLIKPMAPNTADAVPAFSRSLLNASVVDAVNVKPIKPSNGLSTTSYHNTLQPPNSSTAITALSTSMPMQLTLTHVSGLRNRAANADGRLKPYRHSAITSLVWCGSGVERLSWYGNLRIDQVELLAVRELH